MSKRLQIHNARVGHNVEMINAKHGSKNGADAQIKNVAGELKIIIFLRHISTRFCVYGFNVMTYACLVYL